MSGRSSRLFAVGWAGPIALLALGTALGYLGYPWIASFGDEASLENTHLHGGEGNAAGERGIVHIPLDVQSANGLEIRRAEVRPFESPLHVTGTVSADQTRVARIRPLARGVVDRVFVQLGDRVNQGDPLLSYDNIDLGLAIGEFRAANADLRSTRTNLEVSETILTRSREMLEVEAVARTENDVVEAEFRSAQAQVDSARALVAKFEEQLHRFGLTEEDLNRLTQGEDPDYHRTASRATLRTPSSGIVTAYDVGHGEVIDPSSELLTVTDISVVWVLAGVSERDLSAVRLGKPVSIHVSTYPGESFRGRIVHTGDMVEQESRTARVRCVVRNPDGRLKLGMFATIDIPSGRTYDALAVPSEAIQKIQERPVVFVRRSGTVFEQRQVETRLSSDGWVELLSGVSAGDAVIAAGNALAKAEALRDAPGGAH